MDSSSICICLGRTGVIVFVTDGQAAKRSSSIASLYEALPSPTNVADMLFFYAQLVENFARHTLGQNIVMTPHQIVRLGRTVVHSVEPFNDERFSECCKYLGLTWVDSREHPGKKLGLQLPTDSGAVVEPPSSGSS